MFLVVEYLIVGGIVAATADVTSQIIMHFKRKAQLKEIREQEALNALHAGDKEAALEIAQVEKAEEEVLFQYDKRRGAQFVGSVLCWNVPFYAADYAFIISQIPNDTLGQIFGKVAWENLIVGPTNTAAMLAINTTAFYGKDEVPRAFREKFWTIQKVGWMAGVGVSVLNFMFVPPGLNFYVDRGFTFCFEVFRTSVTYDASDVVPKQIGEVTPATAAVAPEVAKQVSPIKTHPAYMPKQRPTLSPGHTSSGTPTLSSKPIYVPHEAEEELEETRVR